MTLQSELGRVAGKFLPQYWVDIAGFLGGAPRREALELFASNPCLGLLLTFCSDFVYMGEEPWDEARRWVALRRHEILGRLGFPATRSAVSILGRIDMRKTGLSQCRLLRKLLSDDHKVTYMRHARVLCGAVFDVLSRPELGKYVTPEFLDDLCYAPDADDAVMVLQSLAAQARRDDLRLGRFRSCADVLQMSVRVTELEMIHEPHWEGEHERISFPVVPVSVPPYTQPPHLRMEPIVSPRALYREARDQHNCVFSSLHRIVKGKAAVYRVTKPERLTVMLVPDEDGFWRIEDCRAIWNRQPKRDSLLAVGAYLTKRQSSQGGKEDRLDALEV